MIEVFIFLAFIFFVSFAVICFIPRATFGGPSQEAEDKLRRELTDWYRNLTDEEREKVKKGIYIGWGNHDV
jgi:hypothetical protein